jgi:hypothetical protein
MKAYVTARSLDVHAVAAGVVELREADEVAHLRHARMKETKSAYLRRLQRQSLRFRGRRCRQ